MLAAAILSTAATLAIGAGILRWIGVGRRTDPLAFPAFAWVVGSIATAAITIGHAAGGKPFDGRWLAPLVLAVGIALLWAGRRRAAFADEDPAVARRCWPVWVALAIALVWVADLALQRTMIPIVVGDEAAIWTAKAKSIAMASDLGAAFAVEVALLPVLHPDYPLLVPANQAFAFATLGDLHLLLPRLPATLDLVALLLILASALRRATHPLVAVLLLFCVVGNESAVDLVAMAQADVPVTCGVLLLVESLRRWRATGATAFGVLAMLAAAYMVAAKNEGTMLLVVVAVAWVLGSLLGRPRANPLIRPYAAWALALLPIASILGHRAANRFWNFDNDLFPRTRPLSGELAARLADPSDRLGTLVEYFVHDILLRIDVSDDAPRQGPMRLTILLAIVAWLAFPRRGLRPDVFVPFLVVIGAIAGYFLVFFVTPNELVLHLDTAAQRVVFHVTPLAAIVIGAQTARRNPIDG